MSEVRFVVKIHVLFQGYLLLAAKECGYDGSGDAVGDMLDEVIRADKAPLDTGFEIVSSLLTNGPQHNEFYFDYHLRISDEASFISEARSRYMSCWGGGDWVPKSLGEAGYEILVASNGSLQSPLEMGFEIVDTVYYADLPLSDSVIATLSEVASEAAPSQLSAM